MDANVGTRLSRRICIARPGGGGNSSKTASSTSSICWTAVCPTATARATVHVACDLTTLSCYCYQHRAANKKTKILCTRPIVLPYVKTDAPNYRNGYVLPFFFAIAMLCTCPLQAMTYPYHTYAYIQPVCLYYHSTWQDTEECLQGIRQFQGGGGGRSITPQDGHHSTGGHSNSWG